MIEAKTLWAQFEALNTTGEASIGTSAIVCGDNSPHLLARGDRGEPILLLATQPRATPRADIRLKNVSVHFDRNFEISCADVESTRVGTYSRVVCDTGIVDLHQHFVELMAATARVSPEVLSPQQGDDLIDGLLEIFRQVSPAPVSSIVGLWGELLVIQLSALPGQFVDGWHSKVSDGFDFAFSAMRIEVKTTETASRNHEFSLRQLRPARLTDLICTVKLTRSSAGLSVLDLARRIADRVSSEQQSKLWRLVIQTLGEDSGDEQRFDFASAEESLIFVSASSVPSPEIKEDVLPFVTEVRFRSNINHLCVNSGLNRSVVLSLQDGQ